MVIVPGGGEARNPIPGRKCGLHGFQQRKFQLQRGKTPGGGEILETTSRVPGPVENRVAPLSTRKAYYPGAQDRYQTLLDAYPHAEALTERTDDVVPWTLITDLDSSEDQLAFTMEPFCGVLSETTLSASGPGDFLNQAVDFLNNRVWGSLNAMVVIDPRTEKAVETELENAKMNLRYGTVSVNHWPAVGYGFVVTPWGAHHGHTLDDIQSGIGVVHNTLFFEKVQKTVITGPFKMFPKPPWFPSHKQGAKIGPKLVAMEEDPGWGRALNVISSAIRG